MENIDVYAQKAVELIMEYSPKVILAIIVLFIGLRIVKVIGKLIEKSLAKGSIDESLKRFVVSLITWGLKLMVFISVASMVGVQTTSFVAVIGAAGLAVGLALQGTLANFAGGALILLFKPFKVGDLIEGTGYLGEVEEIQIFITKLVTFDNKTIIIPNGPLSNASITNYTQKGKIRIDLTVGISYDSNIKDARNVLVKAMQENPLVLQDPAPSVSVSELADSSVNLAVRPWCDPKDYWDVYFKTLEDSKLALDANKITIPFPQRDVHLIQGQA